MQSLNDMLIGNNPVTFKSLSRTLEIKVTKAKEIMLEFHLKNPDIPALFLVRQGNKIKLLSEKELEGDDYEIYSLQATRDQLPLKIKDDVNSFKCCRTRSNNSILVSLERSRSVPEVTAPQSVMKKSNSDNLVKKEAKKTTFFSRFKKNEKTESHKEVQNQPKEKPKGIPVKVVKINKNPEPKDEPDEMDIDEGDIDDEEPPKPKPVAKKNPVKSGKKESTGIEPIKQVKMVESNPESKAQQLQLEQMFAPKRDSTTEIKRIRKRRKITRSETFMDGKYMKTRDVEEWESYDEEMEVVAPAEKKQPLPEKDKPKKKEKGQMTLTSFFKKK
ncbi:hypothetical protein HDV06_001386 [Boothiomyces sp. JEL0866]|nr:hypothetical protein HDV06_001386 [Boothiomyces sp. JEL0866]